MSEIFYHFLMFVFKSFIAKTKYIFVNDCYGFYGEKYRKLSKNEKRVPKRKQAFIRKSKCFT